IKSDAASNSYVSWHYTVDENEIYHHIPDTESAYHAGDGNGDGNTKSIGIEICMNSDGNLLKATDQATELTASLCKKYGIPASNVVQHNRWSGKNCPQMLRSGEPYSWDTFISKTKAAIAKLDTPEIAPPPIPVQEIPPDTMVNFDFAGNNFDLPCKLIDDVNYAPTRKLLEAMGYTVNYIALTKSIQIPEKLIKVNLFGKELNIPGFLLNNLNYVAIRELSVEMGLNIDWEQDIQIIFITKPE
ncbi:MAG: N-acetylmuramoyl-L-alanine amidase, partial [Clostridiales bacterium]|nr:N-acetylmuramoyl-L-alanine amidase [Clostridiales bacterium]